MTVIIQSGYTLPVSDEPLTHARIAHANNWHTGGTLSASTTDSSYFEDAPDTIFTFEKWKPTALPADWESDFTTSKTCDYAVIGAHTLGTNGCSIKIQSWNGVSWDDEIGTTVISSDAAIFCIFASKAATKWRLRITSGTTNPTIGVVKFGQALQMERAIYGGHTRLSYGRDVQLRSTMSETNEFLGQTVQRVALKTNFEWSNLTQTWVDANWPAFQRAVESSPFFIAWRPDDFSEAALCKATATPIPSNMGVRDFLQVSLDVVGYAHD